jgi:acyl carrier protein
MSEEQVIERLTQILRDLLEDDRIVLRKETERAEVPGWDSLKYVNFIVAVEVEFGIRFGVADVESFRTVGEIAAKVKSLLARR